jgi:hypothetical protein
MASDSHEMCNRVGIRKRPAAPYAMQDPSVEMSHASAILRASGVIGTLV